MNGFVVRAARDEDANEGWVWMHEYPSRTVLKLSRAATPCWMFWRRRSVYCQARKIDENFQRNYNQRETTIKIYDKDPTIVMSEWYRDALGGLRAATKDDKEPIEIEVRRCSIPCWSSLRAASHHPEISIRLGTRLGVLGACLGIVSLFLAISSICSKFCSGIIPAEWCLLFVFVVAGLAGLSCRGPCKP